MRISWLRHRFGLLAAALAAALLAAPPLAASGRAAEPDPWLDATERYQEFLVEGRLDRSRIEILFSQVWGRLEGMTLLFVPSWLSDQARAASDSLGVIEYMDAQVAAMRRTGLAAEIVAIDSEASVPANAQVLERRVRSGEGPFCLISHSKGGLDTLEFLLRSDPATRDKVACWVALQAPFAGSPFADIASDIEPVRWMARELLTALGGSERSLLDLREDTRRAYMETFDKDIERLAAGLPILSFATYLDGPQLATLPTFATSELMQLLGGGQRPNDGLVPLDSAVLPHAPYIVAQGIDHNMTTTDTLVLKNPLDRVALTKLLLALVLTLDET